MTMLDLDRVEELLAAAPRARVAVIGDLMLDVYLTGSVDRISPEAPVPVVHIREERSALGGAANVTANILKLGANCDVVGFVGVDQAGDHLRQELERLEGGTVRSRLVTSSDRPTTTKTRVVARNQQVVRFDREEDRDLPDGIVRELCVAANEVVPHCDVLVLEDYNKGVLTPEVIHCAIRAATAAGVPIVVDPKFRNIFEYQGATVFKPNAHELRSGLGVPVEAHDDAWLERARSRFGCTHLLVTLGEEGMVVHSGPGSTLRVPAVAREVFDVSGAGDTVTAFVAVALAVGATIREAAMLANYAAAIEVGKPGVATVSAEELKAMVEHHREEIALQN
jgi:D-glycero-beta-D-manno-heptose-7-phosphate kinase